jgi:hypothetical protein
MGDFKTGFGLELVRLRQVVDARGMDIEKRHHRDRRRKLEVNVVSKTNQHDGL